MTTFVKVHDPAVQAMGTGSGSVNFTFSSTTSGNGLIIFAQLKRNTSTAVSGVTISGETVNAVSGAVLYDGDVYAAAYVVPALSSGGNKTVSVSYTDGVNGTNSGCFGIEWSGEISTGGYDTDTTNTPSLSVTTTSNNSAIAILVKGGFSEPGSASGYTAYDCDNVENRGYALYDEDVGSAGVKSISPSQGWFAIAVEIAAAAAASSPVALFMSHYAQQGIS